MSLYKGANLHHSINKTCNKFQAKPVFYNKLSLRNDTLTLLVWKEWTGKNQTATKLKLNLFCLTPVTPVGSDPFNLFVLWNLHERAACNEEETTFV